MVKREYLFSALFFIYLYILQKHYLTWINIYEI